MTIKVKLLGGTAPMRMTEGSIGYDCFARTKEEIYYKGELVQVKYRLGFAIQLPRDVAGVIAPRSSVYTRGLRMSSSIGVIDPDYRGELVAIFDIDDVNPQPYEIGQRVCQLLLVPCITPELEFGELDETVRGQGGFGSTGE